MHFDLIRLRFFNSPTVPDFVGFMTCDWLPFLVRTHAVLEHDLSLWDSRTDAILEFRYWLALQEVARSPPAGACASAEALRALGPFSTTT